MASAHEPKTLQEAIAYFSDPERAFKHAVKLRFPDGRIYCPRCGAEKFSFIKTRRIWFCYACKKQFTVKVKTIMEDSAIGAQSKPLRVQSVDALRGVIMMLMAIDHIRDFVARSAQQFLPTDLTRTTPAIFLTRWITHFCAPVFLLTAGLGAYL